MCELNISPEELAECPVYGALLKEAKANDLAIATVLIEKGGPSEDDALCLLARGRATIAVIDAFFDFMLWRAQRKQAKETEHDESNNSLP